MSFVCAAEYSAFQAFAAQPGIEAPGVSVLFKGSQASMSRHEPDAEAVLQLRRLGDELGPFPELSTYSIDAEPIALRSNAA